jgi:dihydroorotate dehydrogenase electron transfer subunit
MLKSIAAVAVKHDIPVFASLEERMGCGVGACLVCVCAVHSANNKPHNVRVCADGPVFDLNKVLFK